MQKLFKLLLVAMITLVIFAILLLAYAAQNNTVKVKIMHTESMQDSTKILLGKSIIQ
jgi:uncharacterized membrane protein YidH (DUF202 family)